MNKTIIILMFFCCSCKNSSNIDYDGSTIVDTTMIDSSSVLVDSSLLKSENSIDDTVDNQIQKMQENKLSYEEVLQSNSIEDYEKFIKYNPQHEKIENVKAKLIDLEVEKIYYDKNTGKIPSSEKTSNSNQQFSIISISNDTSCDLELRYSGRTSKMIIISAYQTDEISLKSGSYKIVATACGYHYAGSEDLSGNYSSKYYITTEYR